MKHCKRDTEFCSFTIDTLKMLHYRNGEKTGSNLIIKGAHFVRHQTPLIEVGLYAKAFFTKIISPDGAIIIYV